MKGCCLICLKYGFGSLQSHMTKTPKDLVTSPPFLLKATIQLLWDTHETWYYSVIWKITIITGK